VYRKDYFEEAGLDPNKPPKNWKELHEFARKLVKRDSAGNVLRGGIDIPSTTAPDLIYMETLMRANGSKVFDEEKGEPSWTDKGAIEALDFIATLWKEKLSMPHANFQWMEHPFAKGNSAMGWVMTTVLTTLFKNDPSLKQKVGYTPPMGPVRPYTFCGYRLFTIGSDSKVKDAAWKLIEFMMEPDEMWDRYKQLRIPPVRKSLTERFIQEDPVMNKAITDAVTWGKGKAVLPWTSIGDKYLGQAYEETINGKKTGEQALKDADRGARAELKRIGYLK
ncbi:MAG: extracellular solute-binding protein, partial [Deltaproteobacteria bacterium]|nr:extracellular solute-binding protein [Deltaproteobacteria bacterium]